MSSFGVKMRPQIESPADRGSQQAAVGHMSVFTELQTQISLPLQPERFYFKHHAVVVSKTRRSCEQSALFADVRYFAFQFG